VSPGVFTGFFALGLVLVSKIRSTLISPLFSSDGAGISDSDIQQTVLIRAVGACGADGVPRDR